MRRLASQHLSPFTDYLRHSRTYSGLGLVVGWQKHWKVPGSKHGTRSNSNFYFYFLIETNKVKTEMRRLASQHLSPFTVYLRHSNYSGLVLVVGWQKHWKVPSSKHGTRSNSQFLFYFLIETEMRRLASQHLSPFTIYLRHSNYSGLILVVGWQKHWKVPGSKHGTRSNSNFYFIFLNRNKQG